MARISHEEKSERADLFKGLTGTVIILVLLLIGYFILVNSKDKLTLKSYGKGFIIIDYFLGNNLLHK